MQKQKKKKSNSKDLLDFTIRCLFLFFIRAVSGPTNESSSEPQPDEEDGEEAPLCDPEEMDLLGEIFDTLSSRSSHERGLLYGTRSLDLFGPDSHDYITKVRRGDTHTQM